MGLSINHKRCCVVDTPDMEPMGCSTALSLEMSLLEEKNVLTLQMCRTRDRINDSPQPNLSGT